MLTEMAPEMVLTSQPKACCNGMIITPGAAAHADPGYCGRDHHGQYDPCVVHPPGEQFGEVGRHHTHTRRSRTTAIEPLARPVPPARPLRDGLARFDPSRGRATW